VSDFHYNVDIDIAESQQVCLKREGRERCADIRTRGKALLRKPDSFWDVGAFRTARKSQKELKWSHQVALRIENKEIDTVVFVRSSVESDNTENRRCLSGFGNINERLLKTCSCSILGVFDCELERVVTVFGCQCLASRANKRREREVRVCRRKRGWKKGPVWEGEVAWAGCRHVMIMAAQPCVHWCARRSEKGTVTLVPGCHVIRLFILLGTPMKVKKKRGQGQRHNQPEKDSPLRRMTVCVHGIGESRCASASMRKNTLRYCVIAPKNRFS
jgi:hypothetical protein